MGPVQTLLAVLLLLYLSEHVVWVQAGAWFFRRRGRGWEVASHRSALFRSVRGHLHWVYPIPGLGRGYIVTESASPAPVLLADSQGSPPVSNGVSDLSKIRLQWETAERAFHPLRWSTIALLGVVVGVTPISLGLLGTVRMLWIVVPLLLFLMTVHAQMVFRFHRRTFPDLGDERLRLVLSACLSPIAAIRSMDLAQKWALDGCDPLAVAAALPGFHGWEEIAADRWRRLKYADPMPSASVEAALPPSTQAQKTSLVTIESLARQRGLEPAVWDAPPAPVDAANTRYCPRCRSQFTGAATHCHDCQWATLLPLQP